MERFSAYIGMRNGVEIVFYRNGDDPIPVMDECWQAVSVLARDRDEARLAFQRLGF